MAKVTITLEDGDDRGVVTFSAESDPELLAGEEGTPAQRAATWIVDLINGFAEGRTPEEIASIWLEGGHAGIPRGLN